MTAVIDIKGLTRFFGGLAAVNNFELTMEPGELVGLIGPNGAGKTTIFNLITGVYQPTSGTISFQGQSIVGKTQHDITSHGIARTFQTIRLYGDMPVWQNVAMGSQFNTKYGLATAVFRLPKYYSEEKEILKKTIALLETFGLDDRLNELAKNLPYGEQRRLEICRALAGDPSLLLLDEPAAGMNPNEVDELLHLIRWVHKDFNLTTLLIEHQMKLVMGICPRLVVIDFGQIIARGTPSEIQNNKAVIEAYLGKMED